MTSEDMITVPVTELRVGFGRRLGAILLDGIIVLLLSGIVYLVAGSAFEPLAQERLASQVEEYNITLPDSEDTDTIASFTQVSTTFGIIVSIVGLVYWLMEISLAATPGKMMLGIKIANADATAAPTSVLATRWFIKSGLSSLLSIGATFTALSVLSTLSSIVGFVVFIGCFFALSQNRQALHDIIAKTAVYRREHIRTTEPVS